jgi:hypothetical protein
VIRISQRDAVDDIQRVIVRLGGIQLDTKEGVGLIVMTPEQFGKAIEAARTGAAEAVREELARPASTTTVN